MRLLMFSWRDIKNPEAGGAEVLTFEVAKQWAASGHKVTLFTTSFPGAPSQEKVEGVKIFRRGSLLSVWFWGWWFYKRFFQGRVDVVIDQINTIPFFTPFYVKEKKIVLIHQLAREVFWYNSPFPLNLFGFLFEPLYLRLYKELPVVTVSPSTCQDLINLGFEQKKIQIIPEGINFPPLSRLPRKEKELTLIYLGRLMPAKRVEDVIESFYLVQKKIPPAQLWIVGKGPEKYLNYLKKLVEKKKLKKSVVFWGYVSPKKKIFLLKKAHLLVLASVREGWGLVVNEAAALGTPSLAYDVPGLRDSILNPRTGILSAKQSPRELAKKTLEVWENPALQKFLAHNALKNVQGLSWGKTASAFERVIRGL